MALAAAQLSPDEILLPVPWEAGFPDVTVSEGNRNFCFTWPAQRVSFQCTWLCQACSITSALYPTALGVTKYSTIRKICSGWSTVQWFNSCHVETQHLKSIKKWLIISKPLIPFWRKNKIVRLKKIPVFSEAGKWRNVPCYSKCKICDCHLLDDLKSVQKKQNLCSGWAQLKPSTLTYTSNGASACSSATFGCKTTVNTCRHFLFKSLNLHTDRRRWLFLFQTFSAASFGFSLVTLLVYCNQWIDLMCISGKKYRFVSYKATNSLRHHCISIVIYMIR